MRLTCSTLAAAMLLATALSIAHAAEPDFELTGPDGRRILLKGDGTWRYQLQDAKDAEQQKDKPKETAEAILRLQRKTEAAADSCRFELSLVNNLPYEIRQFVPVFAAHRPNGIVYDTVSSGFFSIKPGNSQTQEIVFRGIACRDIARLKVEGGDRCQMGDLDRFSGDQGKCLARIRVVESTLVRFDK